MGESRSDAGFTLIELLVVVGIVVVVIATLGVFFLAGPSPAVAAATRDIGAAFAEARETATAFQEATVVFAPAGSGYSARVYREMPGTATFQAVNGPTYDSTVSIVETASPMGTPGFAFRIDNRGSVTGYAHYTPGDTTFALRSCPASGSFTLALSYGNQKQTVTIPCVLTVSSVTPGATTSAPPGITPPQDGPGTCPPTQPCVAALPVFSATCPPGYTPDQSLQNVCDAPATAPPTAAPTAGSTATATTTPLSVSTNTPSCPLNDSGTYPNCFPDPPVSPSPGPMSTQTPSTSQTPTSTSQTPTPTSPTPTPTSQTPAPTSQTPASTSQTPTPSSQTPTPTSTPAPAPAPTPGWTWTANMSEGSHSVLGVRWAYWVAVDIEQDGAPIATDVCYGTGTGPSVAWSTVTLSQDTTLSSLTAAGVPSGFATQVLNNCGTYRYPRANPLAGFP